MPLDVYFQLRQEPNFNLDQRAFVIRIRACLRLGGIKIAVFVPKRRRCGEECPLLSAVSTGRNRIL